MTKHTHPHELKGKRILVTGGAGFIGSHITDLLIEEDVAQVVVVDNMVRGRIGNLRHALPSGKVVSIRAVST